MEPVVGVILLFGTVILYKFAAATGISSNSLFDQDDNSVTVLSSQNFGEKLKDEDRAFIVFYCSPFSETCTELATVYQNFAKEAESWKRVIHFGALNCAEAGNEDHCKEHDILSYPAFVFFAPGSATDRRQVYLKEHSKNGLMQLTGDSLLFYLSKHIRPFGWPRLTPFEAGTKFLLMSDIPFNALIPTLLIIEDKTSYLGVKVILDLSAFTTKVTVLRVINAEKPLIEELLPDPNDLPVLVRIKPSGELDLLERGASQEEESVRKRFVKRIIEDFVLDTEAPPGVGTEKQITTTTMELMLSNSSNYSTASDNQSISQKVYYSDLYNALRQTLYKEVTVYKRLNEFQVNAVRQLLVVLHRYFPLRNENARRFVKRMSEWISLRNRKYIDREDLLAIMKAGSEGFLPQIHQWRSCRNETETTSGYSCSLWLVFHLLTVSEYVKNGPNLYENSKHKVLLALRDYVMYFYSTRYAAHEFVFLSQNMVSDLKYRNSSILWLWRTHNQINERLRRQAGQGTATHHTEFPSESACPLCRRGNAWNTEQVVAFLSRYYSKSNIVNSGFSLLSPHKLNKFSYSGILVVMYLYVHLYSGASWCRTF